MEFLLINHPLDCPICDKSGECDLQDQSFSHGAADSRYREERRTYLDLDMGPVIQKNMNRCIHCTRCIRFGDEIAQKREMVAVHRGNDTLITTLENRPLETDYAGNYADICPTGSLTLKDFRFHQRVWLLEKTASVCGLCSKGCNLELHHQKGVVHRCVPRKNLDINQYWLCDEGRFQFRLFARPDRCSKPTRDWKNLWKELHQSLSHQARPLFLIGTDLSQEEVESILSFQKKAYPQAQCFHFGTPEVFSTEEDRPVDHLLKRSSRTPNLHGVEQLGVLPFEEKYLASISMAVIFRGGQAVVPLLPGSVEQWGMGVFFSFEPGYAQLKGIFPSLAFLEKNGTVYNHQGKPQQWKRAVPPPGEAKPLSEILMGWMATLENL